MSAILDMRRPSRHDHSVFSDYFDHSNPRDPQAIYTLLRGRSQTLYKNRSDLVSLDRPKEEDKIFAFLRAWCPSVFKTGDPIAGSAVAYASNLAMQWTATMISVLIAAALLYGAILHFYYVRSPRVILGLIAAYTTAFAVAVGLLTNAKRSEIFAACAAYAAVIVVFVSSPIGGKVATSRP